MALALSSVPANLSDFIIKWVAKPLVDCDPSSLISHVISVNENSHFLIIPSYNGWKNDAQRVRFYNEARAAGFTPVKGGRRVWRKAL